VQRLGETDSTAGQLHLLQRFVAERCADGEAVRQPFADALVERTLCLAGGARRRSPGVAVLAADLGLSTRQLHRRTTEVFGYGPAVLARILRLQRFLHLRATTPRTLAELAAVAGYADQAHLARECRDLVGRPPSALDGAVAGLGDAAPMSDLFKRRVA
jgi:AraC-like DNA-binding protein